MNIGMIPKLEITNGKLLIKNESGFVYIFLDIKELEHLSDEEKLHKIGSQLIFMYNLVSSREYNRGYCEGFDAAKEEFEEKQ